MATETLFHHYGLQLTYTAVKKTDIRTWTHSIDFRIVAPEGDVGVPESLVDGNALQRIDDEHPAEEITCLLGIQGCVPLQCQMECQ